MYEQGVDVIFVPAGSSGIGVIDAATALSTETRPLWVIGVDSDQYYDISDTQHAHLLTSMFKGFDIGIHTVVAAYDNGTLVAPSVVEVGLADGAVGYTTTGEHLGRIDHNDARATPRRNRQWNHRRPPSAGRGDRPHRSSIDQWTVGAGDWVAWTLRRSGYQRLLRIAEWSSAGRSSTSMPATRWTPVFAKSRRPNGGCSDSSVRT